MSKTLITALVLATVGMAGVFGAEAKPVWVFPNKGTPYVLPEGQAKQADRLGSPQVWVLPNKGTPYVLPEGHAKQAGTLG